MISKESLGTIAEVILIIFVLGPIAGQFLGQPVGLSYVETESMSPTMKPGDGFIAIPKPIAGEIDESDVIVFDAEVLHEGGLVTHRVVGEDGDGYITKGDGNPFVDQQAKEPPVAESQIVAVGLQINGNLVVVPNVGAAVSVANDAILRGKVWLHSLFGVYTPSGPTGMLLLVSIGLGLLYGYDVFTERGQDSERNRSRDRQRDSGTDVRFVAGAVTALLLLSATMVMIVPAGTQELRADRTTETGDYSVRNSGMLPVVVFLENDSNLSVQPTEFRVDPLDSENASVSIPPISEGGSVHTLTEHRYLALLPTSTVHSLYTVHPWLPIMVIDALIGIPFYLFSVTLLGTGRIRDRSRSRDASAVTRVRRAVRSLYQ
jgi:signal peptidase